MKTLIKIDKNGSKHWQEDTCYKCNGSGYIGCYNHVDGGRCYDCGGSGQHISKWIERTPEYEQKLEEQRRARALKVAPEKNAKFLEKYGFNKNGEAYMVVGQTFHIKDKLKESGAKYNIYLGWCFQELTDKYPVVKITVDELTEVTYNGLYQWLLREEVEAIVEMKKRECVDSRVCVLKHVGQVGLRMTLRLKFVGAHSFIYKPTPFSSVISYILTFTDSEGNMFSWRTSSNIDFEEGVEYTVKATIKSHDVYKGKPQTSLLRVKKEESRVA